MWIQNCTSKYLDCSVVVHLLEYKQCLSTIDIRKSRPLITRKDPNSKCQRQIRGDSSPCYHSPICKFPYHVTLVSRSDWFYDHSTETKYIVRKPEFETWPDTFGFTIGRNGIKETVSGHWHSSTLLWWCDQIRGERGAGLILNNTIVNWACRNTLGVHWFIIWTECIHLVSVYQSEST